ncbi:MAG: hypothetical protein ABIK31_00885 [candidate division WOR-3 bacterium]
MHTNYGDSIVIVSYNHSVQPELPQIQERMNYYNILAYPTVVFDGTDVVFENNPNAYDTVFNQHYIVAKSIVPSYNLELTGSVTVNSGQLHLKIGAADTIRHDSVYAFIAICEDSIRGDLGGTFNFVVRQLTTIPINVSYPDSLDTIINFNHNIAPPKMRGVVFLQDRQSKKILQAIKTKFVE